MIFGGKGSTLTLKVVFLVKVDPYPKSIFFSKGSTLTQKVSFLVKVVSTLTPKSDFFGKGSTMSCTFTIKAFFKGSTLA